MSKVLGVCVPVIAEKVVEEGRGGARVSCKFIRIPGIREASGVTQHEDKCPSLFYCYSHGSGHPPLFCLNATVVPGYLVFCVKCSPYFSISGTLDS